MVVPTRPLSQHVDFGEAAPGEKYHWCLEWKLDRLVYTTALYSITHQGEPKKGLIAHRG